MSKHRLIKVGSIYLFYFFVHFPLIFYAQIRKAGYKRAAKKPTSLLRQYLITVHKDGLRMVSHKIPLIIFILWVLILVMQSQFTAAGLSYSNKQQGRNFHVFLPWKNWVRIKYLLIRTIVLHEQERNLNSNQT